MSDPQIPGPGDVVGPAVARLVEVRPSVEPHLADGRYGHVVAGWRGQFELARRNLLAEVAATRLSTEGQALTELCASEFETEREDGRVAAYADLVFTRTVVHCVADPLPSAAPPAATSDTTAANVLNWLWQLLNLHRVSVYDDATGLGAHRVADDHAHPFALWSPTLTNLASVANNVRTWWRDHAQGTAWHPTADPLGSFPYTDAFADSEGGPNTWAAATSASQASILGLVNATRTAVLTHVALEARAGVVRAGTTFHVAADPGASPQLTGGDYRVAADAPTGVGQDRLTVTARAVVSGAAGNIPRWAAGDSPWTIAATPSSPLFDSAAKLPFTLADLYAAGGTDGQTDADLRRIARAAYGGRSGPVKRALVAGGLRHTGATRVEVFDDWRTATACVFIADSSWSHGISMRNRAERVLRDGDDDDKPWLGFGCKIRLAGVANRRVRVELSVVLRDAGALADVAPITAKLQATCKAYFDDRLDWYVWRANGLRAAASRADRRILACSAVVVRDAKGIPLAEPDLPCAPDASGNAAAPPSELTHFWLADGAVTVAYSAPT